MILWYAKESDYHDFYNIFDSSLGISPLVPIKIDEPVFSIEDNGLYPSLNFKINPNIFFERVLIYNRGISKSIFIKSQNV